MTEDMVSKVADFEHSDLPEHVKVALRITRTMATYPKGVTDEMLAEARKYYSEEDLVDIVLLSTFTMQSKVTVTVGLDPGGIQEVFYPTDESYGHASEALLEAIDELRGEGFTVAPDERTTNT